MFVLHCQTLGKGYDESRNIGVNYIGDDSASVPPMEMGNMVAFFGEGEEMDEEMVKAASVTLN